jgi:predicted nucleic acid-binding protein
LFRGKRPIAASRLAYVELVAAVSRAARQRTISAGQRDTIISRLPSDFGDLKFVVEPAREVYAIASQLIVTRALRAYDAMQLAACLMVRKLKAVELWAADAELLAAARAEGLKVVAL